MSDPNPPRRPLATFLRPVVEPGDAPSAPQGKDSIPPAPASVVDDVGAADEVTTAVPAAMIAEVAVPPISPATAGPAQEPVFLRRHGMQSRPPPRWQWPLVAVLGLLLLLQVAVADRAQLAAQASTRPWIAALCGVLRCTLPPWHEPTAFTMTSRDVRPVPGQAGALQVQASIRNDARWAQGWPSLRLSLSDADGRVVGTGVFAPPDYLGSTTAVAGSIEPGQSAQVAFRVREPAASTVAFTFEFL